MNVVLVKPLVSEKSSDRLNAGQFSFLVGEGINKVQVAQFFKRQYELHVKQVRIMNRKPKQRRRGRIVGYSPAKRIAIVSFRDGQSMDAVKGMF